ncbi:hypothetical protein GYB22_03300 [bacterium]|nr:hypothetical protein [bacterium]
MNIKTILPALALLIFTFSSCIKCDEPEPVYQDFDQQEDQLRRGGDNKGKGKNKDNDTTDPDPDTETGNAVEYMLTEVEDHDPLYRFAVDGDQVMFYTDPSVTSWGTDYWGYWDEAYDWNNGEVNYIIGLTNVTYSFDEISEGTYEVTKTLIVSHYLTGESTTTVTVPGIYEIQ